ncbi:hypothetical protein [Campylobacter helveticus]|uniref:hypothetical protein n=1 Tax=Campylobacter helveticus TaxID=28898 RepID=UPI00214A41CD|nr:hypothetical protein [Campylobacter helveticus]MCR2066575.1 hypothetical protein [Campylobacter helveticus]
MNLAQRIEQIDLMGLNSLNKFKTSYVELNALACYLDFFQNKNDFYLFKRKSLIYKAKSPKQIKEFLKSLLKQKLDLKAKKEAKKADFLRAKALKKEKHTREIIRANQGGLFSSEMLVS